MKRQAGFTLIELIIAMALVAILTAIAVPNYSAYITRTRLTDAYAGLGGVQPLAEQYWANKTEQKDAAGVVTLKHTYKGFTGLPANTADFTFEVTSADDTTYLVTAKGKARAAGFEFTIDERGNRVTTKVPTGWNVIVPKSCWVRDKTGTCS